MKHSPTVITIAGIMLLLSMAVPAMSQTTTDPTQQENTNVMPAYDPSLATINQGTVDTKNAQLTAPAAATVAAAAAGVPVMPSISTSATTTANGTIVMTFTDGTLLPSDISGLWARVTYNSKTEYWKLDPAMLSSDGKSFSMQFGPEFANVTFQWQLYGFAADGTKTNNSNTVTFKVSSPTTVTMPSTTAPTATTAGGQITVTFATAILPSQLSGLWAKVTYDSKTEYWKLDPGMISSDGKTFTMNFDPAFNGKTMSLSLFGYAAADGSQTNTTNAVTFTITSPGSITIPAITAASQTDLNRNISIGFSTALSASTLSDLWAIVSYDGKTEYWDLDPSMISTDGKTFSMQFDESLAGKEVTMQLFGIAKSDGSQTKVSNSVTFDIVEAQSSVTMPTLPASVTADSSRTATITFSGGTLRASQIDDLWAAVTYDGKTEYWDLDPSLLNAAGTAMSLQFDSSFAGKSVQVRIYAFDSDGIQTGFSNATTITIPTAQTPSVTMPALPSAITTDSTGKATITFSSGTLLASSLNDLWAKVTYDGKTEYWDLDPAMLSTDGKSVSIQFNNTFNGKNVQFSLYGFDTTGVQTGFSNTTTITVTISATTVTMPVMPANVTTDTQGKATITFTSGTLLAGSINDLWAEVKYDGKTEYWDLDPAMLSSDGKSMSIQFDTAFNGKTVQMRLYGFDTTGKQIAFSNTSAILVNISATTVSMPVLPSSVTTDNQGKATITFASGTLLAGSINDLWAEVKYDGKTEYWDLDPAMLSSDGKSMSIQFGSAFNGKNVQMRLYGFDTNGKQISFSNTSTVTVTISAATVTMPTMPSTVTTDSTGKATITFASGTLLASAINDLWAEVKYDGKTEYWDLDPAMLATDGKSLSLQFGSSFNGKTVTMRLYGFDKNDIMTSFTNSSAITVSITPTAVTMPVMPANVTTDTQGKATVTFTSGTLLASSINDLWAEVKYDGKTEYWDLDPAMLATDGRSMSIQFDTSFNGKTVQMRLYGFDTTGKQISFSNSTSILVNISGTTVTMPVLPANITTDSTGKATITFTSGTLTPSQLNDLWAQVVIDGVTDYWDFDPGMLSLDGKTMTITFNSSFNGKTVRMRIYGFDTNGKQTGLSNPIDILVNISG